MGVPDSVLSALYTILLVALSFILSVTPQVLLGCMYLFDLYLKAIKIPITMKIAAISKRRRKTATVGAMIATGVSPKPLLVRTVAAFCSRKKVIANSPALCSTAEVFPLKKSSALTLAETKDTMTL